MTALAASRWKIRGWQCRLPLIVSSCLFSFFIGTKGTWQLLSKFFRVCVFMCVSDLLSCMCTVYVRKDDV